MSESIVETGPHARSVMSAADAGWTSLVLYQLDNDPVVNDVIIEPSPDQQLVLVDSGRTVIQSRTGTRWTSAAYSAGRIGLTPPGQGARLRWKGPTSHRTTHVRLPGPLMDSTAWQLWGRSAPRVRRPSALDAEDPVISATIASLRTAAARGVDDLYAESAATFLATHILIHHTPRRTLARVVNAQPGAETQRIRRVLAYIRDNHVRSVSLAEMAAVAELSSFHFLRVFTAATGTTPHRYLVMRRLDTAERYLRRSDLSVTEIAGLCGFSTPSAFSASFRARFGSSPAAYRRSVGSARTPV